MKQYRFTSNDFLKSNENDCYIDPADPIYKLINSTSLINEFQLEQLNQRQLPSFTDERGKIQREQNIRPGTDQWFKHWFGNTSQGNN